MDSNNINIAALARTGSGTKDQARRDVGYYERSIAESVSAIRASARDGVHSAQAVLQMEGLSGRFHIDHWYTLPKKRRENAEYWRKDKAQMDEWRKSLLLCLAIDRDPHNCTELVSKWRNQITRIQLMNANIPGWEGYEI